MPSPVIRLTNRCPKTSTTSRTPEPRMKSHMFSSKFPVRERRDRAGSMVGAVAMSAPEDDRQVTDEERHEEHHEHPDDGVAHLPLVARALLPEVHEHDADAVERVEQERGDEAGLHETDDRVLVGVDGRVEHVRRHPDHRDVDDVGEEEEEQGDAGDAVQHPRPHAFTTSVERAYRRAGHVAKPPEISAGGTSAAWALQSPG